MLSRSAERLYWLARYVERTENTARLLSVYMNLMFDLPMGMELSWRYLLNICGSEINFYKLYENPTEQNTMHFLMAETGNPGSLFSSLSYARESIRTSRDEMPDEAWQLVNEMFLYAKNNTELVSERRGRVLLLQQITQGCQRFTGFLSGAMSHDHALSFIRLGRSIERADMTTRILDIGSVLLAEDRSDQIREFESSLWINVLKSLSAFLMYRKHRRHRINSDDVLDYLLRDEDFPRAVLHCINELQAYINLLPNSSALNENLKKLEIFLMDMNIQQSSPSELHDLLDYIQARLGDTHNQIESTWFLPKSET
jgi:uncharacterized alpha-E superfamily protein